MSAARSVCTASKKVRPPSGGRLGVEPITMSPTAAIDTTRGGVRLRRLRSNGGLGCRHLFAAGAACTFSLTADGPPVDEEREEEAHRDDDADGTRASRAPPGSRMSCPPSPPARSTKRHCWTFLVPAVAEEDEGVVRELRERRKRCGDVRHRGGCEHSAHALCLPGADEAELISCCFARREASNSTGSVTSWNTTTTANRTMRSSRDRERQAGRRRSEEDPRARGERHCREHRAAHAERRIRLLVLDRMTDLVRRVAAEATALPS